MLLLNLFTLAGNAGWASNSCCCIFARFFYAGQIEFLNLLFGFNWNVYIEPTAFSGSNKVNASLKLLSVF